MTLIGNDKDEVLAWLAKVMGFPPDRETWPEVWMGDLLKAADQQAKDFIFDKVRFAMVPGYIGQST